jgi:hypothetical protein
MIPPLLENWPFAWPDAKVQLAKQPSKLYNSREDSGRPTDYEKSLY